MGIKGWNIAVLAAIAVLWSASSTQREKRVVASGHTDRVALLEEEAAAHPDDVTALQQLVQAYLDARAPGMALAVVEHAPERVRTEPVVLHLYARALLDEGRTADALKMERHVLARCDADHTPTCSTWLIASATRRADILEQLVQLGIEDATAHPEASQLAYSNATRQVRLSLR